MKSELSRVQQIVFLPFTRASASMARAGNVSAQETAINKFMQMPEDQFCSFFEAQLSKLPVVRQLDYKGSMVAPVHTMESRAKKCAVKATKHTGARSKPDDDRLAAVDGPVREVPDLFPLLYNCLAIHAGKTQAQKLMGYFQGLEESYFSRLSLDDIEEIARMSES